MARYLIRRKAKRLQSGVFSKTNLVSGWRGRTSSKFVVEKNSFSIDPSRLSFFVLPLSILNYRLSLFASKVSSIGFSQQTNFWLAYVQLFYQKFRFQFVGFGARFQSFIILARRSGGKEGTFSFSSLAYRGRFLKSMLDCLCPGVDASSSAFFFKFLHFVLFNEVWCKAWDVFLESLEKLLLWVQSSRLLPTIWTRGQNETLVAPMTLLRYARPVFAFFSALDNN